MGTEWLSVYGLFVPTITWSLGAQVTDTGQHHEDIVHILPHLDSTVKIKIQQSKNGSY